MQQSVTLMKRFAIARCNNEISREYKKYKETNYEATNYYESSRREDSKEKVQSTLRKIVT
jgi:hypothetical protein